MRKSNYSVRKPIKIPSPSEKLAEFLGIFLGDGSFSSRYQVSISYNHINETRYAKYIQKLIYYLFGLSVKYRIRKKFGSAELIVSSSNLVDFLASILRLKNIRQKNRFILPDWILKNKRCKIGFVRGLFDSEGCIYRHRYISNNKYYTYIKIAITNYLPKIQVLLKKLLRQLGFHPLVYNNRVHLYTEGEVYYFLKLIGTNNSKNRSRIKDFALS